VCTATDSNNTLAAKPTANNGKPSRAMASHVSNVGHGLEVLWRSLLLDWRASEVIGAPSTSAWSFSGAFLATLLRATVDVRPQNEEYGDMNRLDLRRWRRQRRLTQTALAERLGVTKNTAYRWESGESSVPPFLQLALERLDELHDWTRGQTVTTYPPDTSLNQ
jgi:DNA-binding XRE family transcriptional regulator